MAELKKNGDTLVVAEGETGFELNGWIDTAPFEDLVGITIESAGSGRAVLSLPFRLKLAQGGGLLHGGVLTTLADTAVAMAIKSLLPEGTIFATTDLQMTFLAPVRQGMVRAQAMVSGPEGRTFHGIADLFDDAENMVARFSSTFRVARDQGFAD
ncbi:MAG: PaaI family thioesterase [Desulfuromonas sp.]|nr:MAG: PaaI family thioesterase [Desulfuromonas sp.]